jgi:hypothetical protein
MAKTIVSPTGAGLVLDSITDSDARGFALGDVGMTKDGGGAVFVQASGAIADKDCISISEAFVAKAMATAEYALGYTVGFADDAVSSGQYFWALVDPKGSQTVNVLQACAANVPLFVSGTAGKLDDATVAQQIFGLQSASAAAASATTAITAIASYPRVRT